MSSERWKRIGGEKILAAWNPLAGNVIRGTGGVRKLRWALEGRGKRGGARVIYFFHNETVPLFALTMYGKNEQDDLSQADRNAFRQLTKALADNWSKRR
jgi:hypothetical protein